jgi:hypothetical protein
MYLLFLIHFKVTAYKLPIEKLIKVNSVENSNIKVGLAGGMRGYSENHLIAIYRNLQTRGNFQISNFNNEASLCQILHGQIGILDNKYCKTNLIVIISALLQHSITGPTQNFKHITSQANDFSV